MYKLLQKNRKMNTVRKVVTDSIINNSKLLRIAHRGYAPENKIMGFKKAVARGCDIIECDLRLSADNHPMVIHDKTINRTTCGTGYVKFLSRNMLECYGVPSLEQMLHWLITLNKSVFVAFELKDLGTMNSNPPCSIIHWR